MYNFLDELLIYKIKMEQFKEMKKWINIQKGKTSEYFDSCLVLREK